MTAPLPDLLTVHEVAQVLRVDPATVRRWCAHGVIRAVRAGRLLRIPRAELEALVQLRDAP